MTLATDLIPWLKERVRGRGDGCFYSRLLDQPVGEHFIEVATSPEGWEEAMSRGCVPCTAAEKNPVLVSFLDKASEQEAKHCMNMFGAIMWELFIEHGWMGTDEVVDLSGVSRHFGKFKKYRKP